MNNVSEMLMRLRDIQGEARHITRELCQEVAKDKTLMGYLQSGLVKLNFPTPEGFRRQMIEGRR